MDNKVRNRGVLDLAGMSIPCYVLEDGTRVLSGRGMQQALKMVDDNGQKSSGHRMAVFLGRKSLNPFISKYLLSGTLNPLECYDGNQKINGYRAEALADICEVFLEARKHIELSSRQKVIADQCEILMRAFARVGIIALVDEATGYQNEREHFELQKILSAYISDEILKWQLTFTDDFYREIYRLWGLPFIPKYIRQKPSFIGKLTRKYIYEELPRGVVEKIQEKAGKTDKGNWKYKWHQTLTPEIGREHLKRQIIEVTTLMSVSQSKEQFEALFQQKYHKVVQLEMEFNEEVEEPKTSNFDKKLSIALAYNPLKKEEPSN